MTTTQAVILARGLGTRMRRSDGTSLGEVQRAAAFTGEGVQELVEVDVLLHAHEVPVIEARAAHGRITISCPLFAPRLEKGVLLRSRVLAAQGPAAGDEAWAADAVTAFAALPPMLTT